MLPLNTTKSERAALGLLLHHDHSPSRRGSAVELCDVTSIEGKNPSSEEAYIFAPTLYRIFVFIYDSCSLESGDILCKNYVPVLCGRFYGDIAARSGLKVIFPKNLGFASKIFFGYVCVRGASSNEPSGVLSVSVPLRWLA